MYCQSAGILISANKLALRKPSPRFDCFGGAPYIPVSCHHACIRQFQNVIIKALFYTNRIHEDHRRAISDVSLPSLTPLSSEVSVEIYYLRIFLYED